MTRKRQAPTVTSYAKRWLEERVHRGLLGETPAQHLRDHILPVLGRRRMDVVRPRHLMDMINALRQKPAGGRRGRGTLAPKTVRAIYNTTRAMFADALVEEVISSTPCVIRGHRLPPNIDKEPEERERGVFDRQELEQLTGDPRLSATNRALWATLALSGMRVSECLVRRWQDLEPAEPLPKLSVHSCRCRVTKKERQGTKTGMSRYVPVHPVLSSALDEYRAHGWPERHGWPPEGHELLFPLAEGTGVRSPAGVYQAFQADLKALGLRRRRLHDLRVTFVSLARAGGARADVLKWVSHGPSQVQIIDVYTRLQWPTLCEAVLCIEIGGSRGSISAQNPPIHPSTMTKEPSR